MDTRLNFYLLQSVWRSLNVRLNRGSSEWLGVEGEEEKEHEAEEEHGS